MTDILQHDIGNIQSDSNQSAQKLIRAYFPDKSTTVIQIGEHESCWDVLCKICEKKSLKPGQFLISTVPYDSDAHINNKRHNIVSKQPINKANLMDAEKSFFSYNCNTIYLIDNGYDDELHCNKTPSRRSSTMIAPSSRKTTVRLDSQTFPKTIDISETLDNDNISFNSDKSKSDFSLKRGSKMFGFFLKSHKKNGSDSSSMLCLSPTQSPGISRQQSGVAENENNESTNTTKNSILGNTKNILLQGSELLKQINNSFDKSEKHNILKKTMSDLESELLDESKEDILSSDEQKNTQYLNFTPEIDPLIDNLKSYMTPSGNGKNVEEEDGISDLPASNNNSNPKPVGRRRACTVSIGTTGRLVTSTLRNSKINARRPISGVFEGSYSDVADLNKVMISFTMPDGITINQKFSLDSTLDYVCDSICIINKLDPNNHGLILSDKTDYNLEYDRTLLYYKDLNIPIEKFHVIKQKSSGKHYSTMTIIENDIDVMVFQMSKEGLQVMAGTVPKLIEHLTDNSENNTEFLDTLLLTYRSFITPVELFDELVARFNCLPPENPTEDDLIYYDKMQLPVQIRVIKTLRWWVHYHWQDFSFNYQLSENLKFFLKQLKDYSEENKTNVFKEDIDDITKVLNTELEAYEKRWYHYKTLHGQKTKNLVYSVIDNFEEDVIAQHLCLHDFELFKNIHPIEYLNAIWKAKKTDDEDFNEENTPNLDFFIQRFDKESYWVATEICTIPELKKRIHMLKKWILIANECIKRNNFFSFFSIVAGLNLTPVSRLKKTWDGLSDKYTKMWNDLEKICDPSRNMKNYRDILAKSEPPIVPFLPIYLKDLTFMNDGNDSKVNGMINFDKLRMMTKRVKDISKLVDYEYKKIETNIILQNYISHLMVQDLKKLKEKSLECEPRDKK